LECKTALSEAERIKRLLLDQFAAEHAKAKAEAEAAEAARANAVAAKQAEEILPPVEPSARAAAVQRCRCVLVDHCTAQPLGQPFGRWFAAHTLVLPAQLGLRFLRLADSNTAANKETCGILCGSVRDGALAVTDLVLPKQSGTSDSCTTSGEEEIFGVLDRFDLVTLGWVHTHPTQTAFLSSIDLHTHLSYQLMLPEAVAVVCAPKFGDTATFTLTQHGLDYLSRCSGKGFHPHQEHPPLFERAKHAIDAPEGDLKPQQDAQQTPALADELASLHQQLRQERLFVCCEKDLIRQLFDQLSDASRRILHEGFPATAHREAATASAATGCVDLARFAAALDAELRYRDAYSLLTCHEHKYADLLRLLRTSPDLLAHVLLTVERRPLADTDCTNDPPGSGGCLPRLLQCVFACLFGHCLAESSEEACYQTLMRLMEIQVLPLDNPVKLLSRGTATFVRLLRLSLDAGAGGFLVQTLRRPIHTLLAEFNDVFLDLDLNKAVQVTAGIGQSCRLPVASTGYYCQLSLPCHPTV
uniref:MPN domain-containing protein n=1 Tax=Macrostomum lignano TaxID=282301 RepID=A0A1I8JQ11_9PLAT